MSEPRYWMHETSGTLRPVIEAYLVGGPMTADQIRIMREYLRQWIFADVWAGPRIEQLRRLVASIESRPTIDAWLAAAEQEGIDPL